MIETVQIQDNNMNYVSNVRKGERKDIRDLVKYITTTIHRNFQTILNRHCGRTC